ncbi:MAG: glycosyltransferase family 2 protein, partial [Terriglobia bacterium]
EWCHPKDWRYFADKSFQTHFFVEGAAAYRREVFDHAGLYFEPLFIYHEGWDLGLRILDHGYRILYVPEVQVGHSMSPEGRTSSRLPFLFTRNYIWIAYRDYPLWPGLGFLSFRVAMMAYLALRTGHFVAFLEGIWAGIRGCRNMERTPVCRKTIEYVNSLESERPNIFVRYTRHRTAPQL